MKITKRNDITGELATMDIPVTQDQLDDWENGTLIQDAMPNITREHREFIKTGITPKSWAEIFNLNTPNNEKTKLN